MRSVDGQTTVVTGATLAEAFGRVREKFGSEAKISGSHTRTRRKEQGVGTEKVVEVLVEIPGVGKSAACVANPPMSDLTHEFRQEVERIERMVDEICRLQGGDERAIDQALSIPLAEHLVENGASPAAVEKILTRFAAETSGSVYDRPAALSWLREYLGTRHDDLESLVGHHVFLNEYGGEGLDLILNLAARLTEIGRRVLVVSILPDPDRDEPRLKNMAETSGHDAAVVRDEDQLADIQDHLDGYDLVLVGLPGLFDPRLAEGSRVHSWLSSQPDFHRHLLMSLDRDFLDLDQPRQVARIWNCDGLALTRMDRTGRPAKLLDLTERIPLPISFMTIGAAGQETLVCATSDHLLDRILTSARPVAFRPGLTIEGPNGP